jgi:hypothetical protein
MRNPARLTDEPYARCAASPDPVYSMNEKSPLLKAFHVLVRRPSGPTSSIGRCVRVVPSAVPTRRLACLTWALGELLPELAGAALLLPQAREEFAAVVAAARSEWR